jgi:WD40 repeat protein/uncharacterized caspase-like protein
VVWVFLIIGNRLGEGFAVHWHFLRIIVAANVVALAWLRSPSALGEDHPPALNLEAAMPRLIVQLGHSKGISSVAFSPDGKQVLTGSSDETARIWDAATGNEIRKFAGHTEGIESVTISPDGKHVLTGGDDNTARLWDAATGNEVCQFKGHKSRVTSVAFSPDGKQVLTGSSDETACLWSAASGKLFQKLEGHKDQVWSVAFSRDGKQVLTGSADHTARLWDAATGNEVCQFKGHKSRVTSVAFSPDGKQVLTGSDDNTARLWDAATGNEVCQFKGHKSRVTSVAFSPNGKRVLTGSADGTALLLETDTARDVGRFDAKPFWVEAVAFSPDGTQVLAGIDDHTARLWDAATGKTVCRFEGHVGEVNSVAFSPDGEQILTGNFALTQFKKAARIWDATSGREIGKLEGSSWVNSACFSPNGKQVLAGSGGLDNTAWLWDAVTGRELQKFQIGGISTITSVAFSPDCKKVLIGSSFGFGGLDTTAQLRDAATGKRIREFDGHWSSAKSSAVSPQNVTDVQPLSAEIQTAAATQQMLAKFFEENEHSGGITSIAFSPNGRQVLAGSADWTAWLWDANSGNVIRKFEGHTKGVTSVAFSRNGKHALTGSWDNTARLWDAATAKEILRFQDEGNTKGVTSVAFSHDGTQVLSASEYGGTASLWDAHTAKRIRNFAGHAGHVTSIAFSPNDKWILIGTSEGRTIVWDAATGNELCSLVSFSNGDWAVVNPEGRFDASNLDNIKGLSWIMPDGPMNPLPVEIFLREYYEPNLLNSAIKGVDFLHPVRKLAEINRTQPKVKILNIERQEDDTVTVTVEVANATSDIQRDDRGKLLESGVFDVRLFRDGKLIGQQRDVDRDIYAGIPVNLSNLDEFTAELKAWRTGTEVKLDPQGKKVLHFCGIKIPRKTWRKEVDFSTYAFNADRVKSETDERKYNVLAYLPRAKGRAFVIAIGVNEYENSAWNLDFAVSDASVFRASVSRSLVDSGAYQEQEVAAVLLTSDRPGNAATSVANKASIREALDLLSGKCTKPNLLAHVENIEKLRKVSPEDLVLLFFSGHGTNKNHKFYFLPSDIGKSVAQQQIVDSAFLKRCISSDELALWLKDVDAGDTALIIDACDSAAAVVGATERAFKPGPLGNRGLGQLAYDKGMRVLAASQSTEDARADKTHGQSVLTQALVREGIDDRNAARSPNEERISIRQWLKYAAERVPKLCEESNIPLQTPALFDFIRQDDDPAVLKLRSSTAAPATTHPARAE